MGLGVHGGEVESKTGWGERHLGGVKGSGGREALEAGCDPRETGKVFKPGDKVVTTGGRCSVEGARETKEDEAVTKEFSEGCLIGLSDLADSEWNSSSEASSLNS